MTGNPNPSWELTILNDAIGAIRRSPGMYVGDDPIGAHFVARIVSDLILLDAAPLQVARSGAWYLVVAEKDWLLQEDGTVSFEPFRRLIPMSQGGLQYDRAEVILAALAEVVVSSGADGITWISGGEHECMLPEDFALDSPPKGGRILAFRYDKFLSREARVPGVGR